MSPENTQVVERFAAWMKVQGLSQSAACKLLGCSAGALSQLLSGTYKGDVPRYVERMTRELDRADRRSRAPKRPPLAMTSVCASVVDALRTAHDEGVLAVVMGISGVGKTSAVRLYVTAEPETVLITMRPAGRRGSIGSGHAFLRKLADALAVEYNHSTSQFEIVELCGQALKGTGRLVIVDEIDYASEDALQCLRMIHDVADTGFAMIATPSFLERLRNKKSSTLNQFLGRVAYRCSIEGLADDDPEKILADFSLDRTALAAARLGCHGSARRLVHAIVGAQRIAAEDGGGLNAKNIARAYAQLMEA